MNALARAEAQIAAIGKANSAWDARLANDARYRYLLSVAVENRIGFHEEDSFAGVASYHSSPRSPRRRRAILLAHCRRAKLYNGASIPERDMLEIIRCRRFEHFDVNLAVMAKEHSEGRVGDVSILPSSKVAA
jgi:hypothetical protein